MEKKINSIFNIEDPMEDLLKGLTKYRKHTKEMVSYSIFSDTAAKDLDIRNVVVRFRESKYSENVLLDRAIGSFMALAMADSIGSMLEFKDVSYDRDLIKDFDKCYFGGSTKAGNVTDDTSFALCLADSLIKSGGLNCQDFLKRTLCWLYFGYNNMTGFGDQTPKRTKGLGPTSRGALKDFIDSGFSKTTSTFKGIPSNGTIMRLVPVPLYYHNDINSAVEKANMQARATHTAQESADAAKILAYIVVKCLNYPIKWEGQPDFSKKFFDSLDFSGLEGKLESDEAKMVILSKDKFDWRNPVYLYPERVNDVPYLPKALPGLHATDALAMAMHWAYNCSSPTQSILKVVNLGGDADTVGAVCGQIVGALYGISAFPEKWCNYILQWDRSGEIALRAMLLAMKKLD